MNHVNSFNNIPAKKGHTFYMALARNNESFAQVQLICSRYQGTIGNFFIHFLNILKFQIPAFNSQKIEKKLKPLNDHDYFRKRGQCGNKEYAEDGKWASTNKIISKIWTYNHLQSGTFYGLSKSWHVCI